MSSAIYRRAPDGWRTRRSSSSPDAAIYSVAELDWGSGAGLAERLEARLGLPVDRIVRNAGGASETREALARAWAGDPERFAGLRVVVWELAAREWSRGRWTAVELPPS